MPISFEAASIKPHPWNGDGQVGVTVRGDTLTAGHTCLYDLVEFAYHIPDNRLSGGPAWARCGLLASSDLYQVVAKAAGNPPPSMENFRLMMQALLADRFHLEIHHVAKQLPVYGVTIAERGPKFGSSLPDEKFSLAIDATVNHGHAVRIKATHVSMEQLLRQFERSAGGPLVDHTGLNGFYNVEMEWDGSDLSAGVPAEDAGSSAPSLFGAFKNQLGLKLEAGTARFDTIVIDHAEKPSAN